MWLSGLFAALAITPAAVAQIYKCDGPDGPIYSDRKCGLDAANVELKESSGLSGVNERKRLMNDRLAQPAPI